MKNILTTRDFELLQSEIKALQNNIKELKANLGEAAKRSGSFVDKNPEYESIRSQVDLSENRLKDYEKFLVSVETVELDKLSKKAVGPYCLVTTEDENQQIVTYYLIYPFIAFEGSGIIPASPISPIGKALIGKRVGSIAKVHLPKNEKVLKILDIKIKQECVTGSS